VGAKPGPVLWAEDNLGDQLLIKAALGEAAGDVVFVEDGVLFLEALPLVMPRFAVLDLRMPRIGGLEALQALRGDPRWAKLPAAVFSAGDQPDETAACRALGVVDVVRKPVDFREFTEAVGRIVAAARRPSARRT
jgi:two-component system, response regulator